jgi:hypothetical protein
VLCQRLDLRSDLGGHIVLGIGAVILIIYLARVQT